MDSKVTVFMPIYNGEKYLNNSIQSILSQTYHDFDFLIINDGSTDESVNIINSFDDPRIKLVHNSKNKGFVYLSLSDELREVAKERKIEITRLNLQNLGNELRENMGKEVLAKLVVNKIKNQQYINVVIDGIRNPSEIDHLKNNRDGRSAFTVFNNVETVL